MPTAKKLKLPRIDNVILRNFSLYDLSDEIDEDFQTGAFCLAGANGLGKSTFLTAVNFALTGIVAEPTRVFKSIDEYYKHCLPFAKNSSMAGLKRRTETKLR